MLNKRPCTGKRAAVVAQRGFSVGILLALATLPCEAHAAATSAMPWWSWPLALFAATFVLGIVAVLGGIGGGVLFVPIVAGFFPFNLDFVRGAGMMLALAGALSAGPELLRSGLASLRLAMPLALAGSIASLVGARVGLALPTRAVQVALGVTILAITALVLRARRADFPDVAAPDRWAAALALEGRSWDPHAGRTRAWTAHRTPLGMLLFTLIGFVGGVFGLGAGWASVPALNLVMGAPLKVAAATAGLSITMMNTPSAWVYIHAGAVLPILTVPSILGVMVGARIGARLLARANPATVRKVVIVLLAAAGVRSLLKGLGL